MAVTSTSFIARFPEFSNQESAVVTATIAEAQRLNDEDQWGEDRKPRRPDSEDRVGVRRERVEEPGDDHRHVIDLRHLGHDAGGRFRHVEGRRRQGL